LDWTTANNNNNADDASSRQPDIFDAVFVCNGHYSLPQIPDLPGLDLYFRGQTMHSIAYDDPTAFAGQTVLCVGGRASGSDLAREISEIGNNTRVYLSDTSCNNAMTRHNVTWVPKTVEILPDGRVAFDNTVAASSVEPVAVDTIIFCSGYDYNFPFVNDQSNLELHASQRRVQPLYEQLWHAVYPNVAFVGLPHSIVPFPLFELQVEAVERSWRSGTSSSILPDLSERMRLAKAAAESGGEGKPEGRVPEDTHYLGPMQWEYCRRMADYAGILDDKMEDYIATNKVRIYVYTGIQYHVTVIDKNLHGICLTDGKSIVCCFSLSVGFRPFMIMPPMNEKVIFLLDLMSIGKFATSVTTTIGRFNLGRLTHPYLSELLVKKHMSTYVILYFLPTC
jgi:hypothetical protein